MNGYSAFVVNSPLKFYDRKGKGSIKIMCLPGAILYTIIDSAIAFKSVNQTALLQSCIPAFLTWLG